jgi:asparagine synthetase B (glutamine-hydrolysing)
MPQVQLPFDEAVGPDGLLAAGVELSRRLPAPLWNVWVPAYAGLALDARRQGCRVILTGEGGDEWLGVSPHLAADLLRSLDLPGLYQLWRNFSRSYPSVSWASLRGVLWRFGARPLLHNAWSTWAVLAPGRALLRQRRLAAARAVATPPWLAPEPWIAPDPALRAQVARRMEEYWDSNAPIQGTNSAYIADLRLKFEAPPVWLVTEETFVLGRHTGASIHHPLWDADLVALLTRTRPQVRNMGGLYKALVRSTLARRFPGLDFESQRKQLPLSPFMQSRTSAEAGRAAQSLGDPRVLGELGVVDLRQAGAFLHTPPPQKGWRVWDILKLEAWARAHYRPAE